MIISIWGLVWGSPIGKIAMAGLAALFALKAVQYSGVQKERARVEHRDKTNVSKANKAGAASVDPSARGVRDRYIRND